MFWFKKNKIELVAFVDDAELLSMFPVVEANKMFPAYYNTLKPRYTKPDQVRNGLPDSIAHKQSTIRGCYGINNFNNHGFILPLWAEHVVLMKNGNAHAIASDENRIQYHENQQYQGALDPFHIFKMESPWEFQCNKDIKWMMTQNHFGANSDCWHTIPGLTDFYNQSTTNIFLAVNKNQSDKEIMLRAGSPLTKFFPMTDDEIDFRIELVDDIKKVKIKPFKFFFSNGLTKMVRAKKNTLERNQGSKCPFHRK